MAGTLVSSLQGYQAFGSFHSDDPEKLVRQGEDQYVAPSVPLVVATSARLGAGLDDADALARLEFGAPAKRALFMLDDEWTFVNHGAFGACLAPAMRVAAAWREYAERQPLRFIDRELFPLLVHSVRVLAHELRAPPQEVVPLQNATQGLHAVIFSCPMKKAASRIYMLDIGYGSVKKMAAAAAAASDGRASVLAAQVPLLAAAADGDARLTAEAIVRLVRDTLPDDGSVALAVFDHVTSNTALVLPVRELVELCHARGVPVLVDGAHGPMALPLDLPGLGADYYVGNCHKWMCAPKGCAFLHVAPRAPWTPRPPVVSHGSEAGLLSSFIWDGHRDYSAQLALPRCLAVWAAVGRDRARSYMLQTLDAAVAALARAWGTRPLTRDPALRGCMALVMLPVHQPPEGAAPAAAAGAAAEAPVVLPFQLPLPAGAATSAHAKALQDALYHGYRVEAPVKCLEGTLFVRISAHIYNTAADYDELARAVLRICADTTAAAPQRPPS